MGRFRRLRKRPNPSLGHTLKRYYRVNLHRAWMCFGLDGVALWRQFRAVPEPPRVPWRLFGLSHAAILAG